MAAGPKEFLEGDIRVDKSLDGLGCLGDLGWYCIRMSLWAYDFTLPNMAVVHAGAPRPLCEAFRADWTDLK